MKLDFQNKSFPYAQHITKRNKISEYVIKRGNRWTTLISLKINKIL